MASAGPDSAPAALPFAPGSLSQEGRARSEALEGPSASRPREGHLAGEPEGPSRKSASLRGLPSLLLSLSFWATDTPIGY